MWLFISRNVANMDKKEARVIERKIYINNAFEAVKDGEMSVYKGSQFIKIPEKTLRDY